MSNSSTIIRHCSDLKNIESTNSILIAGFPGAGFVGSISTSYIIEKMNMKQIACIESEFISPGVIYTDGKLRHPFRLYANEEGDICILVCEAPIMSNGIHSVLDSVMNWAIKNKINEVLVLDSIPVKGIPSSNRQPVVMSSNKTDTEGADNEKVKDTTTQDIATQISKVESDGNLNRQAIDNSPIDYPIFIGGIAGGLLSACLSHQIPCTAILVPAPVGIPDPEGASIVIESYNSIINNKKLMIDSSNLRHQGEKLKQQLEQIIKTEQEQRQYGEVSGERSIYG